MPPLRSSSWPSVQSAHTSSFQRPVTGDTGRGFADEAGRRCVTRARCAGVGWGGDLSHYTKFAQTGHFRQTER